MRWKTLKISNLLFQWQVRTVRKISNMKKMGQNNSVKKRRKKNWSTIPAHAYTICIQLSTYRPQPQRESSDQRPVTWASRRSEYILRSRVLDETLKLKKKKIHKWEENKLKGQWLKAAQLDHTILEHYVHKLKYFLLSLSHYFHSQHYVLRCLLVFTLN